MERRRLEPLPLGGRQGLPFAREPMARALLLAGMPLDSAARLAARLEDELVARDSEAVELERVEELACELLGEGEGLRVGARLRRQAALERIDTPIVLLLGGATGTGKSSVATEVAHRLGITRVTSTDFIRETIRAFFPRARMPVVHCSSFEAAGPDGDTEAAFLEQTRRVLVGVEASIERALAEGWSMVIEGVHLVPGLVPAEIDGALVVQAVLNVENADVHRERFFIRDALSGGLRGMERYLDALDRIRIVQACIVGRAERFGVAVIESSNLERATAELLDGVLSASARLEALH